MREAGADAAFVTAEAARAWRTTRRRIRPAMLRAERYLSWRTMDLRKRSPVSVVAEAVARAERGLADLGLSPGVRELHGRVAAVKTVLFGLVRATPTVTAEQRERLAVTAVMLADEVEARRRETREPVSGVLPVGGAQPVVRAG